MRILVQDCDSELYLSGKNEWNEDPAKAWDFTQAGIALTACQQLRRESSKENLQIVFKFEQSKLDIRLPVMGSDCS